MKTTKKAYGMYVVLGIVLMAVLLFGCGGAQSPEERVMQAVDHFLELCQDGNLEAAADGYISYIPGMLKEPFEYEIVKALPDELDEDRYSVLVTIWPEAGGKVNATFRCTGSDGLILSIDMAVQDPPPM